MTRDTDSGSRGKVSRGFCPARMRLYQIILLSSGHKADIHIVIDFINFNFFDNKFSKKIGCTDLSAASCNNIF